MRFNRKRLGDMKNKILGPTGPNLCNFKSVNRLLWNYNNNFLDLPNKSPELCWLHVK